MVARSVRPARAPSLLALDPSNRKALLRHRRDGNAQTKHINVQYGKSKSLGFFQSSLAREGFSLHFFGINESYILP